MGVDLLDLIFRLEKRFDVKISRETWEKMIDMERRDIQARAVHEAVCRLLVSAKRPVPKSGWHRVQISMSEALGKPPKEVRPDSWMKKDLHAEL